MPDERTAAFWERCKAALGLDHDRYETVEFGDSPELRTELAGLVVAGRKRATAGIGDQVEVGDLSVVLDGGGEPLCVIRTDELRAGPLNSVDAAFAWDEGEGDRSLGWWLDAHRAYFSRQAAREGWAFRDDVEVCFERFSVVWPPEIADG
jgi:uncharacterized protein YhfF